MTVGELFGFLIFLGFCYGAYRFYKYYNGTRNTGAGGTIGKAKEDRKK